MTNKWLIFGALLLVIGFVGIVHAKEGGIKVDDDGDCNFPDKEQNHFIEGATAWIWLNDSGNPDATVTVQYTIDCNDGTTVGCTTTVLDACTSGKDDDQYFRNDFTLPLTTEKATCGIKVFVNGTCGTASPDSIGGDSWGQEED